MFEWWTYAPSDFLMYSARAYGRLVERYNLDLWPAHVPVFAACLGVLVCALRRPRWGLPVVALLLAAAWLWIAWAFHLQRYAQINWAAPWLAAACGVQALLLAGSALHTLRRRVPMCVSRGAVRLYALVLVGYPCIAWVAGQPWAQAELAGLAPDPTLLATLALLALWPAPLRWWLLPLPLAGCVLAAVTLWLLQAPQGPAFLLFALTALLVQRRA